MDNIENDIFQASTGSPEEIHLEMLSDLKMENAQIFYKQFHDVYTPSVKAVIFDFSRIRFVDSSGLGVLLRCSREINKKNGKMVIYGIKKSLYTVFKLSGLLKIFKVIEKEDAERDYPHLFY